MKLKKQKSHRPARRGSPFSLWLLPLEKENLKRLSDKTGVDQTKLIRKGLALLFDAVNRGQMELGFPDALPRGGAVGARNASL